METLNHKMNKKAGVRPLLMDSLKNRSVDIRQQTTGEQATGGQANGEQATGATGNR